MEAVRVTNVSVLNNPFSPFSSPVMFEISFECTEILKNDIEWKLTYVTDRFVEIIIDDVFMSVNKGSFKFCLKSNPPSDYLNWKWKFPCPNHHIIITACYNNYPFFEVGYPILIEKVTTDSTTNNTTNSNNNNNNNKDNDIDKISRTILNFSKVSVYNILWDNNDQFENDFLKLRKEITLSLSTESDSGSLCSPDVSESIGSSSE